MESWNLYVLVLINSSNTHRETWILIFDNYQVKSSIEAYLQVMLYLICIQLSEWEGGLWADSSLEAMGVLSQRLKTGGFWWEIFSLQKTRVIQWEHQKEGSQMVRIRQILANFPGKIWIRTHFLTKIFGEKNENFGKTLSKKGSSGEKLSKFGCELFKKVSLGKRKNKEWGQWVRTSWKMGQCGHPSPITNFSECRGMLRRDREKKRNIWSCELL